MIDASSDPAHQIRASAIVAGAGAATGTSDIRQGDEGDGHHEVSILIAMIGGAG
jgi:hypothetical protein